MVTFEWYDISLCDQKRHDLIVHNISCGVCMIMIRKFLYERLREINKCLRKSTLDAIGTLVYKSFIRKLNRDINFIDEYFYI
jgi:hypothetical protein